MKQCPVCAVYSSEDREICPGCGESFASDHAELLEQVELTSESIGALKIIKSWGSFLTQHLGLLLWPLLLTVIALSFPAVLAFTSGVLPGNLPRSLSFLDASSSVMAFVWASLINTEILIPFSAASSTAFHTIFTALLLLLLTLFSIMAFTFWSVAVLKASSHEKPSFLQVVGETIRNMRHSIPAVILLVILVGVLWLAFFYALFQPINRLLYRSPDFAHVAPILWLIVVEMPALYVLLRCSTIIMLAISERRGARSSLSSAWAAASGRIGTVLILSIVVLLPIFLISALDAAYQTQKTLIVSPTLNQAEFLAGVSIGLFLTFTLAALPAAYIAMVVLRKKLQ